MDLSQLSLVVPPMLALTVGVVSIILYYIRRAETDYDLDLKQLRQMLLARKLDRPTFSRVKNRLKIDNLYSEQVIVIEQMFKTKNIDSMIYVRMKSALKLSLDQKLKKFNTMT